MLSKKLSLESQSKGFVKHQKYTKVVEVSSFTPVVQKNCFFINDTWIETVENLLNTFLIFPHCTRNENKSGLMTETYLFRIWKIKYFFVVLAIFVQKFVL